MRIQISGKEKSFFYFDRVPANHVYKVKNAVKQATSIIQACKECVHKKEPGKIGLHKAFEQLQYKSCGRVKHTRKTLDQLVKDVWVSWAPTNEYNGFANPCMSPDEIALTPLAVEQTTLHMAGTIIHEMAHLCSIDTNPKSHQAESVLKQCCKLESVYNPHILGRTSFPPQWWKPKCQLTA